MNKQIIMQRVLTGIKQCYKMTMRGEDMTCASCPYKTSKECYAKLLKDCKYLIESMQELSAEEFAKYLVTHADYTLKGFDDEEVIASVIEVDNIPVHLTEFYDEVYQRGTNN